jgi:putative ABC transport system substrate-binding protein
MFAMVLALGVLAAPLPSDGQQPGKVYRIGLLSTVGYETTPQHCPTKGTPNWQAFMAGLRERGYIRNQNLAIECRYTESRPEQAQAFAAELVSFKPDLIGAVGSMQLQAVKQVTSTIPIVMISVVDPVGQGFVASLARPGGNVTGLTYTAGREIVGKHLQLLKEAVPKVSRVAVLGYEDSAGFYRPVMEAAAQALGVTLQFYGVRASEEFEGAFTAMTKAQAEALLVLPHPFIHVHAKRIVDLAAQSRLPAMYPGRAEYEAGGLMVYEANEPVIFRRLGFYMDKIFNGANPGDLPIEQPTAFDLFINLKTAKALGLTIPPSLLMRADEVIQ